MAQSHPNCEVVGYDTSAHGIAEARSRAAGIPNVHFLERAVEQIPTDTPFGLITSFDVIHDLADPLAGLRRIREALADDGLFLMMEPNAGSDLKENLSPYGALLYGMSTLHCMTQSLASGGAGLGSAWGRERAETLAGEAGFTSFQPLEAISNRFSSFYMLRR
jgi:SAM-dependent methyltransferase